MRRNMLIFRYQLLHTRASKPSLSETLDAVLPDFNRYTAVVQQIKDKSKERRDLLAEKKSVPFLHVAKHMELSRQISALTEDMEELKSEKAMLLHRFDKSDDARMKEVQARVTSMETSLQKLEQAEARFSSELATALTQYRELTEQTADIDADELDAARFAIRGDKKRDAIDRVRIVYGKYYDDAFMQRAEKDVAAMLGEDTPTQEQKSIRKQLWDTSKYPEPQ